MINLNLVTRYVDNISTVSLQKCMLTTQKFRGDEKNLRFLAAQIEMTMETRLETSMKFDSFNFEGRYLDQLN